MSEYPYAHVASKLKDFLEKIPSTGIPDKVTYNELAARGFKSTNDRSILGVLKYLNLVDAEGIPTEHWNLYRNRSSNKALLAILIRTAYSELFAMYPEAQERSDEEIRNFAASKTKVGEDSLQRIVTTFKMLCGMADFRISEHQPDTEVNQQESQQERPDAEIAGSTQVKGLANNTLQPVVSPVSVSLHIHLPETTDSQAADALIQSIARYLLGRKLKDTD